MAVMRGATQRLFLAAQSEGLPVPPRTRHSNTASRTKTRSAALTSAPIKVQPPPVPRIVTVPVSPPQVIHTSAYLQQTQQLVLPALPGSGENSQQLLAKQKPADINANALVWALEKVDAQLNAVEQQPHEVHKALYEFSNGPVGQATSRGVQAAAKLTMTATIEAAKAAAPVGKWALQQGFRAAVGLVGVALEQEKKEKQQQKQLKGRMKKKTAGKR